MKRGADDALEMPEEPELPEVADADKIVVRNVIYAMWALQQMGGGSQCVGWQVQTKADGYLVMVSFGPSFSISLQDLRVVADVNPLRIDSVLVRSPEKLNEDKVGAVVVVKVLDEQQPVRITEVDVVRVRKRVRR